MRARAGTSTLVVLALLCATLTVVPFDVAVGQPSEQARLTEARAALARVGRQLEEAERTAQQAEVALADAQSLLDELEAIVNQVATDVEHQRVAVGDARERLREVQAEAAELEDAFQGRIAQRFKQGPDLTFEVLLNAQGAEEAIARSMLLERILEGDQVDLERLAAARVAVAAEQRLLEAEEERLAALLREQQTLRDEAAELRASRALAAAAATDDVRRLADQHDDLEQEEEELTALIRRRQEEERRAREAAARAGTTTSRPSGAGFAWPMCARVTSEYGPRWGRMHRGIDLGARSGTPIGASRAGTVIFAGWQGGYGQLVLVDHGGGLVSAYAHMSRIDVRAGQQVQRAHRLGLVGSTGNSTGPHLHLEIRVNGSAVNPRQYLSGRPC